MALIIEIRLGLSNCPRQSAICNLFQNLRVLYKVGRKKKTVLLRAEPIWRCIFRPHYLPKKTTKLALLLEKKKV